MQCVREVGVMAVGSDFVNWLERQHEQCGCHQQLKYEAYRVGYWDVERSHTVLAIRMSDNYLPALSLAFEGATEGIDG